MGSDGVVDNRVKPQILVLALGNVQSDYQWGNASCVQWRLRWQCWWHLPFTLSTVSETLGETWFDWLPVCVQCHWFGNRDRIRLRKGVFQQMVNQCTTCERYDRNHCDSLTCVPEAVFDERVDVEVVVDGLVGGRVGDSDLTEPLYSTAPDWEHDMIYERSHLNSVTLVRLRYTSGRPVEHCTDWSKEVFTSWRSQRRVRDIELDEDTIRMRRTPLAMFDKLFWLWTQYILNERIWVVGWCC